MVYVDNACKPIGKAIMCHMIADSTEELHKMAQKLGLRKEWCQGAGTVREHFLISLKKRKLALAFGVKEVTYENLALKLASRALKPV